MTSRKGVARSRARRAATQGAVAGILEGYAMYDLDLLLTEETSSQTHCMGVNGCGAFQNPRWARRGSFCKKWRPLPTRVEAARCGPVRAWAKRQANPGASRTRDMVWRPAGTSRWRVAQTPACGTSQLGCAMNHHLCVGGQAASWLALHPRPAHGTSARSNQPQTQRVGAGVHVAAAWLGQSGVCWPHGWLRAPSASSARVPRTGGGAH